jgi:hypothetical protein
MSNVLCVFSCLTNLDGLVSTTSDEPCSSHIESRTKDTGFRLEGTRLRHVIKVLEWSPRIIIPEREGTIIT